MASNIIEGDPLQPSSTPIGTASPEDSEGPPAVVLATAGYDHTIRFWDVVRGCCIGTLQHNESVGLLITCAIIHVFITIIARQLPGTLWRQNVVGSGRLPLH